MLVKWIIAELEVKRVESERRCIEEEKQRSVAEGIKIHCPHCNAVNERNRSICFDCGTSMKLERKDKKSCSSCGAINNSTNTTCFACGKELKSEKTDIVTAPSGMVVASELKQSADDMLEQQIVVDEQLRLNCRVVFEKILDSIRIKNREIFSRIQSDFARLNRMLDNNDSTVANVTILFTGSLQPAPSTALTPEEEKEVLDRILNKKRQIWDGVCDLIKQIEQKQTTDAKYLLFCLNHLRSFVLAEVRMDDMIILMAQKQNLVIVPTVRELLAELTLDRNFRENIRRIVKTEMGIYLNLNTDNSNADPKKREIPKSVQPIISNHAYWQCSYCGTMNKVSKMVCSVCGISLKTEEEVP